MRPTKNLQLRCKCKTCVHSMNRSSNIGPCKDCQYTHDSNIHGGTIGTRHRTGKLVPTEINILEMRVEHLESILVEILNADHCKCSKFAREREHG